METCSQTPQNFKRLLEITMSDKFKSRINEQILGHIQLMHIDEIGRKCRLIIISDFVRVDSYKSLTSKKISGQNIFTADFHQTFK